MSGAELAVAGWFASSVIGNVIGKARSVLGEQYGLHKGTRKMVDNLAAELPRIEAVIEAAERKPMKSQALKSWLQQLKDAAHEAEDVLDDFEFKAIREKVEGKNKVSTLTSETLKAFKTIVLPDGHLTKLKDVISKLEKLSAGVGTFIELLKLNDDDVKKGSSSGKGRSTSFFLHNDVVIFGRDQETDLILDMILHDESDCADGEEPESSEKGGLGDNPESSRRGEKRRKVRDSCKSPGVLSIFGLGGVGKTTLAQVIYNHQRVVSYFTERAWVYVSDNFDASRLMHEIRVAFGAEEGCNDSFWYWFHGDVPPSLPEVQRKIMHMIQNKRFLLVLDDVREGISSIWKSLQWTLSSGAPGSMVLMTTQWRSVAYDDDIVTMPPVMLEVLHWDSFLRLFEHHAYGKSEVGREKRSTLKPIGEKIAKKLHGLPLAAEVVGSLLRARLDEEHWEQTLESHWWNLDSCLNGILPSLGIVYRHLNVKLRQCFAYCSLFPKNYVFEKDRLVQIWIARGFIQQSDREEVRLEDIGAKWFDELADRSFFQPTLWKGRYTMHDLMRDLAAAVSSDDCCILNEDSKHIPRLVRDVSVDVGDFNVPSVYFGQRSLHTVLFFGGQRTSEPCKTLDGILDFTTSLRILDLSYINMRGKKPPATIHKLSHLRFLDLSFTGISIVPESFCGLCHLQVLNLRGCWFERLPKAMNKLISLRHLHANPETVSLIYRIGKLTSLQELEEFPVQKKEGHRITELKDMKQLGGKLCITNLGNISCNEEAVEARLLEKRNLKMLALEWNARSNASRNDMEILQGLQPHGSLEELTIKYYKGASFPTWMVNNLDLRKLQCVRLIHCERLEILPPLGQLPALKILSLDRLDFIKHVGHEFYGGLDEAFPSLKELTFFDMLKWEDWSNAETRKFIPQLQKLHIVDCYRLREAPIRSLISSLLELKLQRCDAICKNMMRYLEGVATLTHLSVHHSAGIVLPCRQLGLLEVLCLEHCVEVHFEGIHSLQNLKKLDIMQCLQVTVTSGSEGELQEEQSLQSLSYLSTDNSLLDDNPCLLIGMLPSLQTLIVHTRHQTAFTRDQEIWFAQLTSLKELEFRNCLIMHLPSTLSMLCSLKKLTLERCPYITSLLNCLPPNLKHLHMKECSAELQQRCMQEQGADWPNIAHIPCVFTDCKLVHG